MSSCKGLVGFIFGHKFKARYSYGAPELINYKGYEVEKVLELCKPSTYECDVCERCGAIVKGEK